MKSKTLKLKKLVFVSPLIQYGGFQCNKTSGIIDICCMINTDVCWKA